MFYRISLLLLAGITLGANEVTTQQFNSYTKAHRAARRLKRPLLVILNPRTDSQQDRISLTSLQKTGLRRNLLKAYIVAVIDTSSEHGKKVHQLFGHVQLPYVSIIDKRQEYQIYRTNECLDGQRWTQILETYSAGERVTFQMSAEYCPT